MAERVSEGACVRKTPCASCPYRRGVPSGVWAEAEYAKLAKYDGEIFEQVQQQAEGLFFCHQDDGSLCAGWVGHRKDPSDLLALRVALVEGRADLSVLDYRTDVPLFDSGRAAAEHGIAELRSPSRKAREVIDKVRRKNGR